MALRRSTSSPERTRAPPSRIKGLGVGKLQRSGRGNLHVHLDILTPAELTEEQSELLRRLAVLRGEEFAEARLAPIGGGVFARLKDAFLGQGLMVRRLRMSADIVRGRSLAIR